MELLLEFESEEKLERIGVKKIAHRLKLIEAIGEKKLSENSSQNRDVEAGQALEQYFVDMIKKGI